MKYIAYLERQTTAKIEQHLKELKRSGSTTLLEDDHNVLLSRFVMAPASQAIEDILSAQWSLPYSHKTSYQIRRLTGHNKHIVSIFKQDPKGNKLVVVVTADTYSGHSTGSYLGYDGTPNDFFVLLKSVGLELSDFRSTLLHELD